MNNKLNEEIAELDNILSIKCKERIENPLWDDNDEENLSSLFEQLYKLQDQIKIT